MHKQEFNKVEDSEQSKLVFNMFENLIDLFICKITHYFITEKKVMMKLSLKLQAL